VDIDSGSVQNHLDGVTSEKRRQDAERLLGGLRAREGAATPLDE
jgi:hypothetical protein